MSGSQIKPEELQHLPAFKKMSQQQLEHLSSVMIRRTYSAGQLIFLEGDPAKSLWFVAEGRVRIIKQALNGRVQGLCIVNRGKCFGGCPLFDGETNPANAQAVDDVTLLIVPQHNLHRFIEHDQILSSSLLQILSQRLGHLAQLSEGLGAWTVANRIDDCLLVYSVDTQHHPVVSLTHEKLAALAGTVREVVSRHLSRLEKAGIVRQEPGRIIVLDRAALGSPCLGQAE